MEENKYYLRLSRYECSSLPCYQGKFVKRDSSTFHGHLIMDAVLFKGKHIHGSCARECAALLLFGREKDEKPQPRTARKMCW